MLPRRHCPINRAHDKVTPLGELHGKSPETNTRRRRPTPRPTRAATPQFETCARMPRPTHACTARPTRRPTRGSETPLRDPGGSVKRTQCLIRVAKPRRVARDQHTSLGQHMQSVIRWQMKHCSVDCVRQEQCTCCRSAPTKSDSRVPVAYRFLGPSSGHEPIHWLESERGD